MLEKVNLKKIVIVLLLVLNVVVLFTAPRFGWALRGGASDMYRYQGSSRSDGQTVAVYALSGRVLEIGYANRFSRELQLRWDNGEQYTVRVELDGGIRGEHNMPQDSAFQFLFSDLIWQDSGGLFFYRYILAAAALLGCVFFLVKGKLALKSFYSLAACALFIASIAISSRVFTLFRS
jgi:hypothetical protein